MKLQFPGKHTAADNFSWPSPMEEPPLKGNRFLRKVAGAYRRKHASAKPFERRAEASDDPHSTSDGVASDGSSDVATPSTDGDNASMTSHKSASSLSLDPNQLILTTQIMETLISNLFATGSSLKNAYMQLQSALAPYNSENLQIADKSVISELRKFSEFKHFYLERIAINSSGQVQEDLAAQAGIQKKETLLKSYEGIISSFHSQISSKNIELEKLKDMLAQTTLKKEKLEQRLKKLEQKVASGRSAANFSNETLPDLQLLKSAVLAASEAVKSFTKILMSLMKAADWDLDAAASSIHPGIPCARKNHKKLIFESYVCQRMLNGFENETFYVDGSVSSILDPEKHRQECYSEFQELRTGEALEVIDANPESMFGKFCLKKFVELIHPKMEESFFGNVEHRKQIFNRKHPRSQFYMDYIKLAKAIWLVNRLVFSFEPKPSIFQVKQNTEYSPLHMESVLQDIEANLNIPGDLPRVGFTIMPGFRVGKTAVLKCQVYITSLPEDI